MHLRGNIWQLEMTNNTILVLRTSTSSLTKYMPSLNSAIDLIVFVSWTAEIAPSSLAMEGGLAEGEGGLPSDGSESSAIYQDEKEGDRSKI